VPQSEHLHINRIAIVGNPNVGKSSLFNGLTRSYSLVANVPHTTMEVSRAPVRIDGKEYEVIDTPGILSLDLPAEDGLVTRAILLEEHPEVIILCLDSNNFKRSLLLAAQVMELEIPLVVCLNFMDESRLKGIELSRKKLETLLGHTYQGSFYAIGTMNYDDQLEVRGLSKTFGGIVDFLYKNEMLYIDLNNTSLHDITNLLDYPAIMDADTDGNINYDYKKDLLLVKAQLKNAKFLHTDIVDTVYQKSGVNMLTETFDNCSLDINYQNDILIGNLVMENQTNYLSLTNAQINTKENTIDAYFDVKMQKQEFSGKIFGPIEQPKVNLNMQKLIRYQMDKQLDSVVGKGNRKMMESMPMGGVSKDMATEVGASFMGMFF